MEEQVGTPTPETPSPGAPAQGTETAPKAPQTEQATQPEIPEQYRGKSPAELVSILQEKEKFIGQQSSEVGKGRQLEGEVNSIKEYLTQLSQYVLQQQRVQPEPPEPKAEEFDYTNPQAWIRKQIETEINKRDQQRISAEKTRYQNEARAAFQTGRDSAMKSNPRLYEGIEGVVDQAVGVALTNGAITKEQLYNPKLWEQTAFNIRYYRGELDKVIQPAINPVAPKVTENPTRATRATDETGIELDEDDRKFMEQEGLTEKDAVERIKLGMKSRRAKG